MSSSSEQDHIRSVAERIARRLSGASEQRGATDGTRNGVEEKEVAALRAKLSDVQRRLAHVESHLKNGEQREHESNDAPIFNQARASAASDENEARLSNVTVTRSPWLSGTYVPATAAHPSDEKFAGIGEAVSELVDYFESEKTCTMEPGNKPCDHCAMCSTRGF